jgi:L-fuconolactonase
MTAKAIDAHIHIWDRKRGETFIAEKQFPVLTGKAFLPEDVGPLLADTNAESAVLVHGPATVKHALHCLDLCDRYNAFRSVVGWVNLRHQDCGAQLDQQMAHPAFRGIRFTPMLDSDPDAYLCSAAAYQICMALQEKGHLVEILAPPSLFDAVIALAKAHPDLPVVVAHFGLPEGDPAHFDRWHHAMSRLAQLDNIHVKLSGLPLTGDMKRDTDMAQSHTAAMITLFGPSRLLYASNWPVATALARPEHWCNLLDAALTQLEIPAADQHALYYGNAEQLY